jgi:predicted AlkP superfamily phosphohydrolase/phosphomutase
MVSGFISPDLERAVYPPSYLKTLKDMNYRIDIDVERARKSPMLLFKELHETLRIRLKLCKHLWKESWNIFMVVFTGSDRLGHFMWNAYENKGNEWYYDFLKYFEELDGIIGEINSWLKEDDRLVIISDHGMEQVKTNINVNTWLTENGYLLLDDNPRKGYNAILRNSKVFALEPNRIYLNKVGKYPRGSVKKEEEERLTERLIELFYDLKVNGQRVIEKVYRKKEIYHGEYVDSAPDLLLVAKPGFGLRATLFRKVLIEEDDLTGKHNREAFLYVKDVEDRGLIPEKPSVEDVIKIVNGLRG